MTNKIKENLYQISYELLESNHSIKLRVGGFSMFPFLLPGDIVEIQKLALEELKPGNIIVFRRHTGWIAHRLIKTDDNKLITKGDSCLSLDAAINPNDFIGKVISFERNSKTYPIDSKIRKCYSFCFLKSHKIISPLLRLLIRCFFKLKKSLKTLLFR